MTQKPMLRAEVGMRVRCANKTSETAVPNRPHTRSCRAEIEIRSETAVTILKIFDPAVPKLKLDPRLPFQY